MSEDATPGTTDANAAATAPAEPAGGDDAAVEDDGGGTAPESSRGANVRLIVLVGALMLLAGTFLGTRLGRPPKADEAADAQGPGGGPLAPIPPTGELPGYLHYLNICGDAENRDRHINLYSVVAQLRPAKLPSQMVLTVAAAVSANSPERRVSIQGIAPGGTMFLSEAMALDPVDPTRPFVNFYRTEVMVASPEPLMFQVLVDDMVIARRLLHVRPRDMDPTTAPATLGPGPAAPPAAAPGPRAEPAPEPDAAK